MSATLITIAVIAITVLLVIAVGCILVSGSISDNERKLYGDNQ